jgi:hypothetical protein
MRKQMDKPRIINRGKDTAGRSHGRNSRKGADGTSGRRTRLVASSLGFSALLAVGGMACASGLHDTPRTGGMEALRADSAATLPAFPATADAARLYVAVPGTSKPAAASGTLAPAPAAGAAATVSPSAAPSPPRQPEADPAPIERTGNSEEDLAAIAQPRAAPVGLAAKKAVKGGVSAAITEMTAVQGLAIGIGEVAGPAVRFKVTVVNDKATPLSLDRAVVDVTYGHDDAPAGPLSGPDPLAFPLKVAPGASGSGIFIFAVPLDARGNVKIHFNLEAETPIVTFAGRAPDGNKP